MKCFQFCLFLVAITVSHQLPITSPALTFSQLKPIKTSIFYHRLQTLKASHELRTNASQHIEEYFAKTMNLIEEKVTKVHATSDPVLGVLSREAETSCIKNLKSSIEFILENAGYSISNCIYDGDGVANTAYRSFYQIIDARERDFNLEPIVLTNAFSGRNVFTQSRMIITRAQNQYNARVTSFDQFISEIQAKLDEVTGTVEQQIVKLSRCFDEIDLLVSANIERVSQSLGICQKFVPA